MHHALRAAALECCRARVMRAARSACSMHACACYRSTHVPAGNPPSCAADGGHTTMRRSSACAAQRAKGGLFKADDGSSATVPDRPLPASSAAAPARARPPSAAGAPPPGSLVRGAFDRSMAARLVQPARASFAGGVLWPSTKCCRYTRVAERPKDKVPESKSFGSFETFWIEYVVQTYTCKFVS